MQPSIIEVFWYSVFIIFIGAGGSSYWDRIIGLILVSVGALGMLGSGAVILGRAAGLM